MSRRYKETNFTDERRIPDERIENYDIIRRFDHAMLEYFTMWLPFQDQDTGEAREGQVPFVFATPKREHIQDEDAHIGSQGHGDFEPTSIDRVAVPGMTLTRMDATFDQSRWSYTEWRKLGYSNDLNLVQVSNFPLPYNFLYQIDFWAETYHDLNIFMETFARRFPRPTWWLDIKFPLPWGLKTVHMQSQGTFGMNSVLEGGIQQRELRGVASVVVYGWIPLSPRWVRTVQRMGIDVIEDYTDQIMEEYVSDWASKPDFWDTGFPAAPLEWS